MNNIMALVQITAWRWPSNKPLPEPMMIVLLMHVCFTRPQWVIPISSSSFVLPVLVKNNKHTIIKHYMSCTIDSWYKISQCINNNDCDYNDKQFMGKLWGVCCRHQMSCEISRYGECTVQYRGSHSSWDAAIPEEIHPCDLPDREFWWKFTMNCSFMQVLCHVSERERCSRWQPYNDREVWNADKSMIGKKGFQYDGIVVMRCWRPSVC